ncbi:MAG: agmatine deiminase family protein [Gammaproteobacteria bacterium]|nr:agmatine deiminase family protein [Gammaproteobacteria bacterium]
MKNYFPLPEWHTQAATILVWPHRYSDWANMLDEISTTYVEITHALTQVQNVIIIYFNNEHKLYIKKLCNEYCCNMQNIIMIKIETNDTWVRDYGPQILLGNKEYQYIDLEFNAWGEHYACRLDNLFSESLFKLVISEQCQYHRSPLVLEGGNLEFDSNATLLTNIACVKRNLQKENIDKEKLIESIKYELSAKHVLSVDVPALTGDDTGGHIDTLARFIDDNTIVYAACHDPDHPDHSCLLLLLTQLRALKTKQGKPYELIPVPLPKILIELDKNIFAPASYINFVFANDIILVPMHDDEHDQLALDIFDSACPDRKVVGINAKSLLKQYGSLHCSTLQIPENVIDSNKIKQEIHE